MRSRRLISSASLLVALAACAFSASGQQQASDTAPVGALAPAAANRPYLARGSVNLYRLLPPPPAAGSAQERAELDELLQLQGARTPAEVQRARDDANVSIFRFADALGSPPNFTAQHLPLTARLFARITQDESQFVDPVKDAFDRPRPFLTESRLSPSSRSRRRRPIPAAIPRGPRPAPSCSRTWSLSGARRSLRGPMNTPITARWAAFTIPATWPADTWRALRLPPRSSCRRASSRTRPPRPPSCAERSACQRCPRTRRTACTDRTRARAVCSSDAVAVRLPRPALP
jgi:hypothetical protein